MATSDTTICEAHLQLLRRSAAAVAASSTSSKRYSPPNPYVDGGFTQLQLDTRRKREILLYKPTLQSSQTNSETKKQYFARSVAVSKGMNASTVTALRTNECSAINKNTNLVDGVNVPLYNFGNVSEQRITGIENNT